MTDYVVVGETRSYSFDAITKAVHLIGAGARSIPTNPEATAPGAEAPLEECMTTTPATTATQTSSTRPTKRTGPPPRDETRRRDGSAGASRIG